MTYNINTFKTKTLADFKIDRTGVNMLLGTQELQQRLIMVLPDNKYRINFSGGSEAFWLTGVLSNGELTVEDIGNYGQSSGTFQEFLEDVLIHSTGEINFALVWEGGDTVERVVIKNGALTRYPIEL